MSGFKAPYVPGWDTHGLPTELKARKKAGVGSSADISELELRKMCQEFVEGYIDDQRNQFKRLGVIGEWDNPYITLTHDFEAEQIRIFAEMACKGYIYKGLKPVYWCPECKTALAEAEIEYAEDPCHSIYVKFNVTDDLGKFSAMGIDPKKVYFVIWTTTTWTLPGNVAICVGPSFDYAVIKCGDEYYIMAEELYKSAMEDAEKTDYEVVATIKGSELEYMKTAHPFMDRESVVIVGDHVTLESGTGCVHTAPGHGVEDYDVCRNYPEIPIIVPVDENGVLTEEAGMFAGLKTADANKPIAVHLEKIGALFALKKIIHQYPHCWRCGSPLIYRGIGSWFVKVADEHERLLKANSQIKWQPAHIKEGRFGKWLAGARDWAISRNRYWGNPIPIWKCSDCNDALCVGSRKELEELSGVYPEDLHKQFVDKITIPCKKCGGTMKRIPEVFDCWFESGSMPYAQQHYPFENKEYFESHFPADFISEGLDQTRGWFYTLTVLASNLFDKPAFKNCIVNGIVLASDGRKMSKSLRNYTDPNEAINKLSADAIRLFLMHSAVVKADEIRYSDEGVRDVIKSIILPLWNSYSFFVQYANIDGVTCTGHEFDYKLPENPLDRWILSVAQKMVKDVSSALDDYDLSAAIDPMLSFIDQINNWYIRRNRRRFWKAGSDADKLEAYGALYSALKTFALVAAPFIPFLSEELWQNLKTSEDKESVHLMDYPVYNEKFRDEDLEFKMASVQKAVSMGRSLRNQFNLKNRQPLASVALVTRNAEEKKVLSDMQNTIAEELNVKNVIFHEREDELVEYKAKANFRVLGKQLGGKMKAAAAEISRLSTEQIEQILDGKTVAIKVDGEDVSLNQENVLVERFEKEDLKVINDGTLTVGLDTKITDELKKEGYVRDLIRGIQNLRKESGFEVTDRIALSVGGSEVLKSAFEMFKDFISGETLASSAVWSENIFGTEIDCEDARWTVSVKKI